MSLLNKLLKNSKIKSSASLDKSIFFNENQFSPTDNYVLNIALSGSMFGGLSNGITQFAGPSAHFKTLFGLVCMKGYLDKYKDAIVLYYDTEFGTTPDYVHAAGIDPKRVVHTPVKNIEELKFDMINQLENISRGDHVFIFIDSIGNIASKKEVDDALKENQAADMTRAKQLKSLFRMATPYITMSDIPCVVVNHTYQEMGLFPKAIVSGGTGAYYSSNSIFTITRSQEKVSNEIRGYKFTLTSYKSRFVKEKSKFPVTVLFEGGIKPYSGLLDIALQTGHVRKPSNGKYEPLIKLDKETGEMEFGKPVSERLSHKPEFWDYIINESNFDEAIQKMYSLGTGNLINDAK